MIFITNILDLNVKVAFHMSDPDNALERPWQRICRSDYHRLLQESPALVRRRRSSTWYAALGVCQLCSRSRFRRHTIYILFRCNVHVAIYEATYHVTVTYDLFRFLNYNTDIVTQMN